MIINKIMKESAEKHLKVKIKIKKENIEQINKNEWQNK